MKVAALLAIVCLTGCNTATKATSEKTTRLKDFNGKSDVVLVRRFFDEVLVHGTPPNDQRGIVSLLYTPGSLTLEPESVSLADKPGEKVKGAYIELVEDKWVITGSSPERGGGSHEEASIDDDELLDLQAAIEAMQTTARGWKEKSPGVHTEIAFEVRDRFRLRLIEASPADYEAEVGNTSLRLSENQIADLLLGVKKANSTLKAN